MPAFSYSLSQLSKILDGTLISQGKDEGLFSEILVDSRRLAGIDKLVFFALVTRKNNGHRYLDELYQKGVRNFVVSEIPDNLLYFEEATVLLVKDSLKALQRLASWHRSHFSIPVIGITGSNGKTIIKEWLFQLLSPDKNVVRSPKSFNSQLGVPLSVLQLSPQHDIAIFEAGISEPDEMLNLESVIQPEIGIFTNIGQAHSENFINITQKTGEKLKLFTKVKTLIYCFDHTEIMELLIKTELNRKIKLVAWSRKSEADLFIQQLEKTNTHSHIKAVYETKEIAITIPFTDEASIENAIHCWLCMLLLEYPNEVIARRMAALSPVAMRLELKEGINNCSVINDSYNSDVNSLSIALDFLNQQKQHRKRTLILSDILQSGKSDYDLYMEVASLVREKGVDHLIGIGSVISRQKNFFDLDEMHFFDSTHEFLRYYPLADFHNETILLKGARVFEFENITRVLQQKAHETVLEINLNNLIANLNFFRSIIKPETKIMVMVKAFSYGNGSYEIANILQFHQVDYLAVAYADEGVELRRSGITLPVMVMSPEEQSLDSLFTYNLEPEIYSFRILNNLLELLRNGYYQEGNSLSVHLKLDTGMHRLGFTEDQLDELIELLKSNPAIQVKSVFSHLAGSEDNNLYDFTKKQINAFTQMSQKISESLGYPVMRHILNSAGISRFSEAHFEMVRLGIGLYGIATDEQQKDSLSQIGRLKTTVTQIKDVPRGDSVGYSRGFIAENPSRIAILPIGYADGMSRSLGNGKGKVWINNHFAPIIGNICMDMTMIDITGLTVHEGDDVIIFGPEYPITDFAKTLGTIPYEVLTSVSRRVKRIYYHE